jgi:hypothetical protein
MSETSRPYQKHKSARYGHVDQGGFEDDNRHRAPRDQPLIWRFFAGMPVKCQWALMDVDNGTIQQSIQFNNEPSRTFFDL